MSTLHRVSQKRSLQLGIYAQRRKWFLAAHPWCGVFSGNRSTEIHHRKGREGNLLLNEEFWLAVSREGHLYIHGHPREAYEKGWLLRRI